MTYGAVRNEEQLRLLEPQIERFVAAYRPEAPTILMLPGGMASSLSQATAAYPSQPKPPYNYALDWLGANTLSGGALDLAMQGGEDANGHVTVAPGVISLFGITPYAVFDLWCSHRTVPFNVLILPWDWRRRPSSSVDFILDTVLPLLQQRILAATGDDFQAAGYSLISHSFGGLVLKMILDRGGPWVDAITRAITVAAPFYGYGGSQHFYFAGFPYLDVFYSKLQLAQVIGSMRGPYTLMFLDQATYAQVGEQLAADPHYPLPGYPSVDATDATQAVDPYHPGAMRYPDGGWVDMTELAHAAHTRTRIAAPLPASVQAKFYNIRGVQTADGKPSANTPWSQTWAAIQPGFNPDTGVDPVTSLWGAGDDTVPAWSARLVNIPASNVITITDMVEHMTLMDSPTVLAKLEILIRGLTLDKVQTTALQGTYNRLWDDTASAAELLAALDAARRASLTAEPCATLDVLPDEEKRRLARRFIKDLLKGPPALLAGRH